MKTPCLFITLVTIAFCAFAPDSFAKGKSLPKPKPTPEPKKVNASSPIIVSVSSSEISVKSAQNNMKYRIDNRTSITLDGARVSADGLKAGLLADVTPSSLDPGLAISVVARTH